MYLLCTITDLSDGVDLRDSNYNLPYYGSKYNNKSWNRDYYKKPDNNESEMGKGRRRRRRNKKNKNKNYPIVKLNNGKKDMSRPKLTKVALDFSLLTDTGDRHQANELLDMYTRGKISTLVFICDDMRGSEEDIEKVKASLSEIDAEWIFPFVVFNSFNEENIRARIMTTYDIDAFIADERHYLRKGNTRYLRNRFRRVGILTFQSWQETIKWLNGITPAFYTTHEPSEESLQIIETTTAR